MYKSSANIWHILGSFKKHDFLGKNACGFLCHYGKIRLLFIPTSGHTVATHSKPEHLDILRRIFLRFITQCVTVALWSEPSSLTPNVASSNVVVGNFENGIFGSKRGRK